MRDLARWPMENGSVIRIMDDCASYVIIADEAVAPTSELPSHLSVHNDLLSKNSPYKASVHTHPIELIAMTHCPKFLEKDVATNLLWSMIPETKAFCPRGLGIIPYKLPSSVELAEATIKELQDYDVVMWEKHGVFAVDCDAMQAFDQIDVLIDGRFVPAQADPQLHWRCSANQRVIDVPRTLAANSIVLHDDK